MGTQWKTGLLIALLATLVGMSAAIWAFGFGSGGSPTVSVRYTGTVEYTVRDAAGRVKEHRLLHNTVLGEALETAMRHLIDPNVQTNTAGTDDGTTVNRRDTFRRIAALNTNTDDPVDGNLVGSISTLLDGDTGTTGNQNPANGTYADVGTTTDGQGRVQPTFTATGNATIRRIVLTKAPVNNTAVAALAIASTDVLAHRDVTIDLANADTVQFTWTVNLD